MKRKIILWLYLSVGCIALQAQNGVFTQHNNLYRTGWNNHETILHTKNVKAVSFGKLFSRTVDDQIYAQPLVVLKLNMPSVGLKNVVYIATVNNTVYAFDADSANVTSPYWQVNLSPGGTRPILNTDMTSACGGYYRDFSGKMGIVGTPVIDSATNTLYVVARTINTTTGIFQQYLHALDITTGAERPNSPKLITAQVNGNGDGNVNGKINFDPQKQNQRSGLLLLNGVVYITYAAHCDWGPYHGWILGYDKTSLAQNIVYNTTPEGYNGGIWMSGAAPSADEAGHIYVAVGNGSIGVNTDYSDLTNRSESALKLTPAAGSLTVNTFFTPKNFGDLEAADLDFGVTEIMLIPGTDRAITGCKDGKLYLLDRNNMGGYNASNNNVIQTIDLSNNAHLRSSLGYYKGTQKEFVYSWSENALLKAFPYNRATNQFDLNNTISSGVQGPTGNSGAVLAVTSNGSIDSTAILWTSFAAVGDANQSVCPGILRAFQATDVTKEIWNSSMQAEDVPGNYAKFNCPTVINGKVYLATFSNSLTVYGLTGKVPESHCSANLALNQPAVASSSESVTYPASAAFDGNVTTRWSTSPADPQYLYVNLGSSYDLCNVTLKWEDAYGRDYLIQVSDDALTWTTIKTVTGNTSKTNDLTVQGTGQYVRMYGTARAASYYGYSLWEFEVYGTPTVSCQAPSGLNVTNVYEDNVQLHWTANGAPNFNVQYKTVSATNWTTVAINTTDLTLTGLACATDYLFQVQGLCDATHSSIYSASSAFSTLTCNSNCGPLPTRWTTQDIGDVDIAGSGCFNSDIFELKGSGTEVLPTQDAVRFSYKTLVGDMEIPARVLTTDQNNPQAKVGIMIRESLAPGAKNVFLALSSTNGVLFQSRTVTDGATSTLNTISGINAPAWIKLVKVGSLYTAYHSVDGFAWSSMGSVDTGFGAGVPVYAGLAITSNNNAALATATVDKYPFSSVLAIQFQNFAASLTTNRTVALQWVTTLETNIQNFVIERSGKNLYFTDLAVVEAVNNGKFTKVYTYDDKSPLQSTSYYRLRIIDKAGVVSYSVPVSISIVSSGLNEIPPSIYSNPTKDGMVHIRQGSTAIKMITLYDYNNRVIACLPAVDSEVTDIPVQVYANGLYIVEIKTAKATYREKLVIRN